MSMLVEESSSPARATNSGLENTKKPDYQSGFFCACRSAVLPFFPLHLRDFSFSFFVASNAAERVGQQLNVVTGVFINPIFSVS
ncbi:hypothetical protein LJL26_004452 [Salmonella enterica]|nr:hypothetical protein [Salmonella enterica]